MSRAGIEDLSVPVALGSQLPAIYQRLDPATMALTETLDDVLAPLWSCMDCFDAYLDPALAPLDFVDMLATWIGLVLDRTWSEEQTRRMVAASVELYRWRGTTTGIARLIEAYTGVAPSAIHDSGGVVVGDQPGNTPPGDARPEVRVDIVVPANSTVDHTRLLRVVQASVPAHVLLSIDLRVEEGAAVAPTPPPFRGDEEARASTAEPTGGQSGPDVETPGPDPAGGGDQ